MSGAGTPAGVLIIEDEPQIRRLLHLTLESNGFRVIDAATGEEGLLQAATGRPEVIVLDLGLPDADGTEVLREIRKRSSVPILVLSVRNAEQDIISCLEAGADDYLIKPFDLDELLARLRALIRRSASQAESRLQIGDVCIDVPARTVRLRGEPVTLTAREYALLEFLAFHRGKVVTRSMIWEHLYDEYDENTSNVVDVYIRYLRNKIDKGFDPPLILTRWGEGYMLRGTDDAPTATPAPKLAGKK